MRCFSLGVFFVVFSLMVPNAMAGEAFAEKPNVPKAVLKNFLAASINKAIVPEADQVDVPQYPNAKIITSFKGVMSPEGTLKRLPFLELITTDDYDQVVSFYKTKLSGWEQGGFNTALYFAKKGKVNMFSPKSTHVGIHDVLTYYRENEQKDLQKIIPGAKSLIKIFYTGR